MSPHGLPKNELYPNHGPLSPDTTGGMNVASRMNDIAPRPFGVNHNNSSKEYVATHREGGSRAEEQEQEVPRRSPMPGSDYSSRRRTSQSPESQSRQPSRGRNAPIINAFGQRGVKVRTEEHKSPYSHQPRRSDIVSNNSKIEGLRPEARSRTFPVVNRDRPPSGRLPPHPGVGLPRSPSVTVRHMKDKPSTNLLRVLPAPPPVGVPDVLARASESRRQPSTEDTLRAFPPPGRGVSPPVEIRPPPRTLSPLNPNEYSNFSIGNPYEAEARVGDPHMASPSMSSNASSIFSHRSECSSTSATSTCPPTPDVSGSKFGPEPSNAGKTNSNDQIDGLMKELQSSIHDLVPTPVQDRPKERSLSVPRNHARGPSYGHPALAPLKPSPTPLQRQPPPPGVYQQPPLLKSFPPTSSPRPLQYIERLPDLRRKQSMPLGSPVEELFLPPPPPPPPPPPQTQERPARRPTTKGNCRGCRGGIVGKSISSADGRLTGRYHKACFVCQDCRKPFESAEFYVHNNLPYCKRHYHKLNQSLCPTCDRGIEGPCLETEWHERYHPSCFSCSVSFPSPTLEILAIY